MHKSSAKEKFVMNYSNLIKLKKSDLRNLIIFMLCLITTNIWALPKVSTRLAKPSIYNIRHIYARYDIPVSNTGRFYDTDPGTWLRGTNEGYIFGAGIWIGAKIDGNKQVTVGYNTQNCQTEFVPGNLPNEPGYNDPKEIVYVSTDYPNAGLPPWPKGYNTDGNPITISEMDTWSQCNDLDSSKQFVGGKSLGALITAETYSWTSSFRDVWDIAFVKYTIKNIHPNQKTWDDAYVGFAMDADICDPTNDLTGCIPDLNIGYAYSAEELSGIEEELEHPPGYIGIKFLDGPARDPITGQAKMTSFRRWADDPTTDEMRYDIISSDYYDLEDTEPADKRIFLASGPFDLAYGESTTFVIAFCFAWPMWYYDSSVRGNPEKYADYLKIVAQNAQFVYDNNYRFPQPPALPRIKLTALDQKIVITWDDVAERTVEKILSLPDFSDSLDFEGYKLWKSTTGDEGSFELLGQWDKVSFDDLGNPIGNNTGLVHSYVDEELINGKLYYYAVTAYDKGEYQPLNYGNPEFEVVPPLETGMVFAVNFQAEAPNSPPSNFTQPQIEGLELVAGVEEDIQFTVTPEYLISDSVKDKTFEIRFSDVPSFRYDKEITGFGPDIHLVDTASEDTIISTLNFPISNPSVTVKSDLFDGMLLKYTGPNLLLNQIDTVYFKQAKADVRVHQTTEYDDFLTPQTAIPLMAPFGAYFLPHDYLVEFYELAGRRRVNVYDLDSGDTLLNVQKSFGQTYGLASYEKVVLSVNPVSGDTTWSWYNNPIDFRNSLSNEATGYKVYLPGAFIFIEDPNKEIVAGDTMIVSLSGVGAPHEGNIYRFSTVASQVNYHTKMNVKVVPNPYLVRAAWDIDNDYQKVQFINLPTECTIRIYTLAGDLVNTIHHNEPYRGGFDSETKGTAFWNLMTRNNQKVATGVYVFYIDSPYGNDVGKFAIIR
jgi:hypothetical protein